MKIEAIAQLTPAQIEDLHLLYQSTWWGKNRTIPGIRKMLQNTDLIIGFCEVETKKLIGFTRVITDYVYRAVLWDVMVEESYRGQGLGKALVEAVINHPSLQEVEAISLVCLPEMVPFYENLGFNRLEIELMTRGGMGNR
jgi:ribosomal protein S18 acetylase RimI-like enzyme